MPIYLRGQQKFLKEIDRMGEVAQKAARKVIQDTAIKIMGSAKNKAPSLTGKLKNSIKWDIRDRDKGRSIARVKAPPWYAFPVEFGYKGITGRGNRDNKRPLSRDLSMWAWSKGINVFALSKHIWKKGYRRKPFFFKSMDEEAPVFAARMQEIISGEIIPAGESNTRGTA